MDDFFQPGPQLGNQYESDNLLRSFLQRTLPDDLMHEVEPRLRRMGARAVGDLLELGNAAEERPPRLIQYDPWGRRVDRIEISPAWRALHAVAAEEGLVATGYERHYGPYSRLVQFALLYLFHPSTAVATCPLAMTDGAARVLELCGDEALQNRALPHLLSRDPRTFWTSGQWMTERAGGSDVSSTHTAASVAGAGYRLSGSKWFSSATTSEMALTLARIEGAPTGSRGLSLFYLETHNGNGELNGIRILRLKDKLGTRALPTAELELVGAAARRIGAPGDGVRTIASMLNITRLYNACCAAASMRRGVALARDFALRREAFGRPLSTHALHRSTLAGLEVEARAALLLVLRAAELLGRDECGAASAEERAVLRLLTPLAKLFTGKQAVACASETLECFGGAGYIEDTGLPRLLRDAQVLPIWEGTTNVLALDVLRVLRQDEESWGALLADVARLLPSGLLPHQLARSHQSLERAVAGLRTYRQQCLDEGEETLHAAAREFAFGVGRVYAGALLLNQAAWELGEQDLAPTAAAADQWCARLAAPSTLPNLAAERLLALFPG
ncbi:MAG: acyl-CoA dehydrogenase family protein [Acidobacteriota bacterium]